MLLSAGVTSEAPLERVDVLLHTLRGERHLRRALLEEIIERLSAESAWDVAARAARGLLASLASTDVDFESEVRRLEGLIASLPATRR